MAVAKLANHKPVTSASSEKGTAVSCVGLVATPLRSRLRCTQVSKLHKLTLLLAIGSGTVVYPVVLVCHNQLRDGAICRNAGDPVGLKKMYALIHVSQHVYSVLSIYIVCCMLVQFSAHRVTLPLLDNNTVYTHRETGTLRVRAASFCH